MRHFIDAVRAHSPLFPLTRAALLFLGLALLFQSTAVAETYVAELIGWRVINRVRADLAAHCLRLDMSFHKACLPGETIERIDGDVSGLSEYFSRLTVDVAANVPLPLGMLVVISAANPPTGLCLLALLVVGLSGTEDIRACGATGYILGRLYPLMRALYETNVRSWLMDQVGWAVVNLSFIPGQHATLVIGPTFDGDLFPKLLPSGPSDGS